MLAKKIVILFILVILPIFLLGCASTTAPKNWLPTANQTETQAYGAWISVEYKGSSGSSDRIEGEFITVGKDTIFVLKYTEDTIIAIPLSQIKSARLTAYDSKYGSLALWTLGGALSTASHGVVSIISFPAWVLIGSIATSAHSYAPIESFPNKSWEKLKKYARFPQGLPSEIKSKTLKGK